MDALTQFVQSLTGAVSNVPSTIQDIETEVHTAKMYGVISLALLAYIAVKVSKR